MSSNRTPIYNQTAFKDRDSTDNVSTTPLINNDSKAKTTGQAQRQQQQPVSDYWKSPTSQPLDDQLQTTAMSTSTSTSRSPAPSSRGSSSIDTQRTLVAERRRSSIERAMDKAKSKLGRSPQGAETLPKDELEFERQRAKAAEKQRRKEEYERLGLGDQTKFGMRGGVGYYG